MVKRYSPDIKSLPSGCTYPVMVEGKDGRFVFVDDFEDTEKALIGLVQAIVTRAYPRHTEMFGPPFGGNAEEAMNIGIDLLRKLLGEDEEV